MKIILIYLSALFVVLFIIYFVLFDIHNYEELSSFQKYSAQAVLNSFEGYLEKTEPQKRAIVDFDSLLAQLSFFNRVFVGKVFEINPSELGFKGPFYSKNKPGKLIMLESVKLKEGRETGIQYLPEHIFHDYFNMMTRMKRELGRQLFVDSGYRSPGRQAYLFFYYLVKSSRFSLRENAKWIAMPGYSEHGHPVNTAIDFTSEDGINGFSDNQNAGDFTKLPEYEWLLQNAHQYNFYLSYPENNNLGVAFEPWHWHWEKK